MINQERQLNKFLDIIINLLIESDHPYQVNESIVDIACDTVEKDTSMLSVQELPGQHAHDNDGVNSVDKATLM